MESEIETLLLGKQIIAEFIQSDSKPEENRLDVNISPDNLKVAVQMLVDQHWGYLMTITGMDYPPIVDETGSETQEGMIGGLYHFANQSAILTLRVKVPYSNPTLDSICEIIPSATIYEREFMELFGVDLIATPDSSRLVLPDNWPENVYPLRKSFTSLQSINEERKD